MGLAKLGRCRAGATPARSSNDVPYSECLTPLNGIYVLCQRQAHDVVAFVFEKKRVKLILYFVVSYQLQFCCQGQCTMIRYSTVSAIVVPSACMEKINIDSMH